jgi:cysteine-rich repeat protein
MVAWRLRSTARVDGRVSTTALPQDPPAEPLRFPTSYVVVAREAGGDLDVDVVAVDQEGAPVGRARGAVTLVPGDGAYLNLVLVRACRDVTDCQDGVFCNGRETCVDGACAPADASTLPCPSAPHACVRSTCVEEAQACDVRVDHALCPPVAGAGGVMEPTYCDTMAGCVRGQPCYQEEDCQDASTCNGTERCVSGRCLPGTPPNVDDRNACTVDACVEGRGQAHFPVTDGSACTIPGASSTLCLRGACVVSTCGDGFQDPRGTELCDDGPQNSDTLPGSCRTDCRTARCGDGVTDPGEECDDGGDDGDPGCLPGCIRNTCGDGVLEPGPELCDDGNTSEADACLTTCKPNTCGDGHLWIGRELCDDGNTSDTDGCLSTCRPNTCGDGFLDPQAEECDDGNTSNPDACLATCRFNTCGDGHRNALKEECDDGNDDPQDGCLPTCRANVCGDGVLWPGREECDDGNLVDGDTCLASCVTNRCGDRVLNPAREVCDDGNTVSGDGCRGDCGKVEQCGDSEVDHGEACDDANDNPNDGCNRCRATTWDAHVLTGRGVSGGRPGDLMLRAPLGVAVDRASNLYLSDFASSRVWRLDKVSGELFPWAGNPRPEENITCCVATLVSMYNPAGLAMDQAGNLYVPDQLADVVHRVTPAGSSAIVAGRYGVTGNTGDGGPAEQATLNSPFAVAVDKYGTLYLAERGSHRVRRVKDGVITLYAGTSVAGYNGDSVLASTAQLNSPSGLATDSQGNLYIADEANHRVRKVNVTTGLISTHVGTGVSGRGGEDGPAAGAQLFGPFGLAFDGAGRLLVAEVSGCRVLRVNTDGTLHRLAGTGTCGLGPDGQAARASPLGGPVAVAADRDGNVVVAELDNRLVRLIQPDGTLRRLVGSGLLDPTGGHADFPSRALFVTDPEDVGVGPGDNVYVISSQEKQVWQLRPDGSVARFAGTGLAGFSGDNGPALNATFGTLNALAVGPDGTVCVADVGNRRVRCVGPDGILRTVAGNGAEGAPAQDGLRATEVPLGNLGGMAMDGAGRILLTDFSNHAVWEVDQGGTIRRLAGLNGPGFGGDNGLAVNAQLNTPIDVAPLPDGSLLIADLQNRRVRRLDVVTGILSTVAGNGDATPHQDGVLATQAALGGVVSVIADAQGNVFIGVTESSRVRRVDHLTGLITTVVGTGVNGFRGDGGPAVNALLGRASSLAVDSQDRLWIADSDKDMVRVVLADGTIQARLGKIDTGDGALAYATLSSPQSLVRLTGDGLFAVAELAGSRVRTVDLARGWVQTVAGYPNGFDDGEDPSRSARFSRGVNGGMGLAFDGTSRLFASEYFGSSVRMVTMPDLRTSSTWTIETLAGVNRNPGYVDGPFATARFGRLHGLAYDQARRRLHVSDYDNDVVRTLDLARSVVSTLVGTAGACGFYGEGEPAASALLCSPLGLAMAHDGSLYISDGGNHRVRRVDPAGIISTVLGQGAPASVGEGAPARHQSIHEPEGLVVDPWGNLFVTGTTAVRVVASGPDAVATGEDEVRTIYGAVPRDTFPASVTSCLVGLAMESDDGSRLLVTDRCQGWVLRLTRRDL